MQAKAFTLPICTLLGSYFFIFLSLLSQFSHSCIPPVLLQQLPTMNNLQTELKVYFEDENTGQYSSAYYLPILPNMTAAEICECALTGVSSPYEWLWTSSKLWTHCFTSSEIFALMHSLRGKVDVPRECL